MLATHDEVQPELYHNNDSRELLIESYGCGKGVPWSAAPVAVCVMPGLAAMSKSQLQQLTTDSSSPAVAQQLIDKHVPERMTALLSQHVGSMTAGGQGAAALTPEQQNSLLQTLRIVRNLCAVGEAAVKQLSRAGAAEVLIASACALLMSPPGAPLICCSSDGAGSEYMHAPLLK